MEALASADQEHANLLPQRRGPRAAAGCRWAHASDDLLMLALDEHLLIAEPGDLAIGF